MRVMVMIQSTGADEAEATPSERLLEALGRYDEQLVKAGILLDGQCLEPSAEGVRVVFEGGATSVVGGPFTPSTELVSGAWIWEVSSLEEAVEWARRCPADPASGTRQVLEIRPLRASESRLRVEGERRRRDEGLTAAWASDQEA